MVWRCSGVRRMLRRELRAGSVIVLVIPYIVRQLDVHINTLDTHQRLFVCSLYSWLSERKSDVATPRLLLGGLKPSGREKRMSRTFKDKPYRVLKREALEHGYTYLRHNWMHPTEPPTVEGDVAAYSYSRGRKEHIPSGHRWHGWHDYEDDWYPDYVGRHTVRDRCRIAVRGANTGSWTTIGMIPGCTVAASSGNAD